MAFASIGRLANTIEDRSIVINMRRRRPGEKVEQARRRVLKDLSGIARKIKRWALDHADKIKMIVPNIPDELDHRAGNNWEPLLAIAEAVGDDVQGRAREAAVELSGTTARPADSVGTMLLENIAAIFEAEGQNRLASQFICAQLAQIEDRPWGEFSRGKPLTPHRLAKLLAPFGVHPFSDGSQRVYSRSDFHDAFARYLPAANSVSALDPVSSSTQPAADTSNSPDKSTPSNRIDTLTIPSADAVANVYRPEPRPAPSSSAKPQSDAENPIAGSPGAHASEPKYSREELNLDSLDIRERLRELQERKTRR